MMTLWCIFRSPLMLGAEMPKLDEWTLSLLTNERVLALMGSEYHGVQVERDGVHAVWASRKNGEDAVYAALFNFNDEEKEVGVKTEDGYAAVSAEVPDLDQELVMEELWTGEVQQSRGSVISSVVKAHGAKLFCIRRA